MDNRKIGVWFPIIRAESGSDIFTERLIEALNTRGIRAEATWLPHRAEYAPWTVAIPKPPEWANVVHINNWLHPRFIPCKLPLVTTLHSCAHDPSIARYKSTLKNTYHQYWLKRIEERNIKRSNCAVTVSEYTAAISRKIFGRNDIIVIYNGIRTNIFTPIKRAKPNGNFKVLYAGNWMTTKGVDLLEPIFKELGKEYTLIYTAGRNNNHEKFRIPSNSKKIERINTPAEMVNLYQQCDALIFPTRFEGFGLVAAEAMACGLPVICSDNSSLPEVVVHGKTGFLCATDNVKSFADSLRLLAENSDIWQSMSRNAIEHAKINFSEEIQIEHYVEIYTSLLIK